MMLPDKKYFQGDWGLDSITAMCHYDANMINTRSALGTWGMGGRICGHI